MSADDVKCPKCGSAKIHAEKRGWSIWVGFIGSAQIVVTCLACGHKFKPGEGVKSPAEAGTTNAVAPAVKKVQRAKDDLAGEGEVPTFRLD